MSKHIVLIRHGESEGQRHRRKTRRYRSLLQDSYLTKKGERQAKVIPSFLSDIDIAADFDLICTSPLTSAIATCVLAFGHLHKRVPIVCHPDLAEVGGSTPENQARPLKKVVRELTRRYRNNPLAVSATRAIDFSLLLSDWPSNGVLSSAGPPSFLEWLRARQETRIAVVCHHDVILQKLLRPGAVSRVPNGIPIPCQLAERFENGGNERLKLSNASQYAERRKAESEVEVKYFAYDECIPL